MARVLEHMLEELAGGVVCFQQSRLGLPSMPHFRERDAVKKICVARFKENAPALI